MLDISLRGTAAFIFVLVQLADIAISAPPHLQTRQSGSSSSGWSNTPNVSGAKFYQKWSISPDASVPVYLTEGMNNDNIKTAVIMMHGIDRDCWNHFDATNQALQATSDVSASSVAIMAPCFFTDHDLKRGAAVNGNLVFGPTQWGIGEDSTSRSPASVSSFTVMDALVDFFLDQTRFPNLNRMVIGGHSLGGQMTHRYAVLGRPNSRESITRYWVANPASFLYLTTKRLVKPAAGCEGVDDYKYGLSSSLPPGYDHANIMNLGRAGIVNRYKTRKVHHAQGLDDHLADDTSCQAEAQGSGHLDRGQKFISSLDEVYGGLPTEQSVDYIAGAKHDIFEMVNNPQTRARLFTDGD